MQKLISLVKKSSILVFLDEIYQTEIRDLLYQLKLYLKRDTIRYCRLLWGGIFIDCYGDVYVCSHLKPGRIGNIYKESFEDIWNGETMRKFRFRCLNGALHCRSDCFMTPRQYTLKTTPSVFVPVENLKKVFFSFGERCNINCIMCSHRGRDLTIPILDFEKIKNKIPTSNLTSVLIMGGEPLLLQDAIKCFKYYGQQGVEVTFLTNGTIMNKDIAAMIVQYSKKIYISINAGTKKTHEIINKGSCFEKVIANIATIKRQAKELEKDFEVILHMTIVKENIHEIPLFIRTAKKMGADSLDFGYDVSVRNLLNLNKTLREQLEKEITIAFEETQELYLRINKRYLKSLGMQFVSDDDEW